VVSQLHNRNSQSLCISFFGLQYSEDVFPYLLVLVGAGKRTMVPAFRNRLGLNVSLVSSAAGFEAFFS